jgi:hypothetical protein
MHETAGRQQLQQSMSADIDHYDKPEIQVGDGLSHNPLGGGTGCPAPRSAVDWNECSAQLSSAWASISLRHPGEIPQRGRPR